MSFDPLLDLAKQALTALPFVALAALGLNLLVLWTIRQIVTRHRAAGPGAALPSDDRLPHILVQLPVYNEPSVIARLIEAVAALDWPRDRLRIQLLDDSTDGSEALSAALVQTLRRDGFDIRLIRRSERREFKAGALANGLREDDSPFVAIFDADFVPLRDFLRRAVAPLLADQRLAFVQGRWEHLNAGESSLTAAQGMMIDAHFVIEQQVRSSAGLVLSFNGTCGVWRRAAIDQAGGWSGDTLCEDLDLSIRATLAGWRGLYLPELAAPGELPATIAAWRTQQFRWTKGFAQVARKLLGRVWRSNLPLAAKIGLTMQTTQAACYPLSALALLATPVILADAAHGPHRLSILSGAVALLGMGGSALCLATAKIVLRRRSWLSFPLVFAMILLLNAGLMISNSRAFLEALTGTKTPFVRTPKRGEDRGRMIADMPGSGVLELLAGVGLGSMLAYEVGWLSPLFSLSVIGLLLVGAGLAWDRFLSVARRTRRWPVVDQSAE